ncbi:MAG: hypothetical protein D3906_10310, partial [Candidatus Electrothrix sp. AUS1_2]|nr:hypothetical protein [Candidatus Electrothrix sp. AUS1_2]
MAAKIRPEHADVVAGEPIRFILTHEDNSIEGTKILIYDDKIDQDKPYDIKIINSNDAIPEFETTGLASGAYKVRWCSSICTNGKDCSRCKGESSHHIADTRFNVIASSHKTDVTLQRSKSFPTDDQALWATIRNSTNAVRFERYQQFIELVFNGNITPLPQQQQAEYFSHPSLSKLNIYGSYSYAVLKIATQAFLTLQCGLKPLESDLPDKISSFLNEKYRPANSDEEARRSFEVTNLGKQLKQYMGGENGNLPYLNRIASALLTIGPDKKIDDYETLPYYNYILQHRFTNPSLIELIWSYWHEEGMLAQTMNAIALRFQNQRSGPNDPLAELEIDPLRPLNNMIWGFVQDRYNQLSVSRRAAEYGHQYGLRLLGRAVPELQIADNRSKFIEAFHNLLYRTAVFYREDADTTVVSNAFPLPKTPKH